MAGWTFLTDSSVVLVWRTTGVLAMKAARQHRPLARGRQALTALPRASSMTRFKGVELMASNGTHGWRKLMPDQRSRPTGAVVLTLALVGVALFGGGAGAQGPPPFTPSANPVSDPPRTLLARESEDLDASAELM